MRENRTHVTSSSYPFLNVQRHGKDGSFLSVFKSLSLRKIVGCCVDAFESPLELQLSTLPLIIVVMFSLGSNEVSKVAVNTIPTRARGAWT